MKPVIELSHSSAAQIDNCPRKYQIRKRFQWPAGGSFEDSLAAMGGRAIHCYLQALYVSGDVGHAHAEFFREWSFAVEASARPYDRAERSMEACLFSAYHAADMLNPSPDNIARVDMSHMDNGSETTEAVEVKFNIKLSHQRWKHDYHYRGLIDLVLWLQTSSLNSTRIFRTVDIKTHRSNRPSTEHRYRYSTQTVPYGLVIEALTGNRDAISDGDLAFEVQYFDLFVDLVRPRVETFHFTKTHTDVMDWLRNCALRIESIERYAAEPVWPRTEFGCESFSRPCAYYGGHCGISDPATLQQAILDFQSPAEPKPFGEWLTLEIDLTPYM